MGRRTLRGAPRVVWTCRPVTAVGHARPPTHGQPRAAAAQGSAEQCGINVVPTNWCNGRFFLQKLAG